MTASFATPVNVQTLEQRLAEGTLSAGEALKHAMSIAEALRDLHDSGKVHGWLTPSAIALKDSGIELLDTSAASEEARKYTAPEVLAGEPADFRSDIFSLGALLSAMVYGPLTLEDRTLSVVKPTSQCPAMEHFLNFAMAHDPAARPQRMHKALMELKFVIISIRRADAGAIMTTVREVMRGVDTVNRRLIDAEHEIENLRTYSAMLEEKVASGLQSHEQTLHAHAAAIESAQSSTEQTDNLVERVVDALGLLQSTLIEQNVSSQQGSN